MKERERLDQVETLVRDYWISNVDIFSKKDIKSWGAKYFRSKKRWVLLNTNPNCPDYIAIEEMGCTLIPIVNIDPLGRPGIMKIE